MGHGPALGQPRRRAYPAAQEDARSADITFRRAA